MEASKNKIYKVGALAALVTFCYFCYYFYVSRNLMKNPIYTEFTEITIPTCGVPEHLFRNEEAFTIRKTDLSHIKSVLPYLRRNKCIDKIKWNHESDFSYFDIPSFNFCVSSSTNFKKIQEYHLQRLVSSGNYNITSSYFSFLRRRSNVTIIEVGGYTGQTLRKLIPATGAKHYVVIEPVPSFFKALNKNIQTMKFDTNIKTYNFGLSKFSKELTIKTSADGTQMFGKSKANTTEKVQLVSVLDFFIQLGVGCQRIDLLTINCEGCEFEVLENLLSTNLIQKFDFIQFQPHYTALNIGDFRCRYCRLRQLLSKTHVEAYNFPFIWEAWKRKQ